MGVPVECGRKGFDLSPDDRRPATVSHSMRVIRCGSQENENHFILTVRNIDRDYCAKPERDRQEKERELFNRVAGSLARVYDTMDYLSTLTNYTGFSFSNLLEVLEKPDGAKTSLQN